MAPLLSRLRTAAASGALAVAVGATVLTPVPAQAATKVTPGNFTGFGFDQCLAPSQSAMDAWLTSSPYWAVGIYVSGKSRACRSQPNLTPAWVSTQLRKGWRLLPITLGPQASCSTRFPRYGDDPTVNPDPTRGYSKARAMGRAEAGSAVDAARALGVASGSTLWYDLESFDIGKTRCRESAMWFMSAWTRKLHDLRFVSGFYSSASTGIKMMDDARVNRPGVFTLPDRIWIADWDQKANVESTYIRSDGWRPHSRMKQYMGGHDETWGGVRINIDRNFLDLGLGSTPRYRETFCGGVRMDYPAYPALRPGVARTEVKALQCLLTRQKMYAGALTGVMDAGTVSAVRALRKDRGLHDDSVVGARVWLTLHSRGLSYLMKYGAAGETVRRLQRSLNSVSPRSTAITGVFEGRTTAAVKRYQSRVGTSATGVVTRAVWRSLQAGRI